ncbi:MAG: VOC family protein, partial [Acidobacteriota bacterium]|nr:VOC family protein [Acidobacteriota bacterium]
DQVVGFYTGVLGFRVSDWIEDRMAFLRCSRKHHVLAFSRADHASVNHVAYVMANVDGVMTGLANLRARGQEPGWGPGRHGPGNNIFAYFRDPAGYVCEYTSDMEHSDEETHKPTVWKRSPESADRWGTAGPASAEMRNAMAGDPDPGWATSHKPPTT